MSFYIEDVHPKDAWYCWSEHYIGEKIDILEIEESKIGNGYLSVLGHIKGESYVFFAVKIRWEDY